MPVVDLTVTNANSGKYVEMIRHAYQEAVPSHMDAAVAYTTHSGVAELISTLSELDGWRKTRKRWLVGIDYCRSDPTALDYLNRLPASHLRIHDGTFVSQRSGCAPRVSYHPKLYMISGPERSAVVVGSGNLSHTGLTLGIEAGVSILDTNADNLSSAKTWFSRHWRRASVWETVKERYCREYASLKNRQTPMASEDDSVPEIAGNRGHISPEQLRQLRVCQNLWIEAGTLTKNRGRRNPGNQLMLKRNSRVFFGFPASDLTRDSLIGHVAIEFDGQVRPDCSLRFSNNHMDVLTLPVPDAGGPPTYDNEILCFKRIDVRTFRLRLGTRRKASDWKRRSLMINASLALRSGRKWGVY